MNGFRDCHTEGISQKDKENYHTILLIHGFQKSGSDELICKAEIELQMQKTTYGYQGGMGRVG